MLATLKRIYSFAERRKFRYGINEKYLSESEKADLKILFRQGLVFYKMRHGNRYWLPTKKGREAIESKEKKELEEMLKEYEGEPYEPEPVEWWEVAPSRKTNIIDEDKEAMKREEAKAELSARKDRTPYE